MGDRKHKVNEGELAIVERRGVASLGSGQSKVIRTHTWGLHPNFCFRLVDRRLLPRENQRPFDILACRVYPKESPMQAC